MAAAKLTIADVYVAGDIGTAHCGRDEPARRKGRHLDTSLEIAELTPPQWRVVATVAEVASTACVHCHSQTGSSVGVWPSTRV
jgi:hypothetical protein